MKSLIIVFFATFLQPQAYAHNITELKTAACSDPWATTFARVDRTAPGGTMYGVFYHLPTLSNSYLKPRSQIQLTRASKREKYDAFGATVTDEKGQVSGTMSLSFLADHDLSAKETAYVSFLDQRGVLNAAFVNCVLSF